MAFQNLIQRTLISCAGIALAVHSQGGKVIVAGDDQTFAPIGFSAPNDGEAFALNVANFFTGGVAGSFLVYSDHPALSGPDLEDVMTAAGHTWTISTSVTFDVPTLLGYDGVFVGGFNTDVNTLADYVAAGGNVYLAAGAGPDGPFGDHATEAAIWNVFLGPSNLALGSADNGQCGTFTVVGSHALSNGVAFLHQCNGQDVAIIDPGSTDPAAEIVAFSDFGEGLGYIAVSVSSDEQPIPNDECVDATAVSPGITPFSTIGATTGGPFEEFPCTGGGSDIWFRFTPACSGSVVASLCGSALDTIIHVYDGCPADSGQYVVCNDDRCGQQSRTDWFGIRGHTYYLRIGGFEGAQGTGMLELTTEYVVIPGDLDRDGAVALNDLAILLSNFGQTGGATYEEGNLDGDDDVDLNDLTVLLSNYGLFCN